MQHASLMPQPQLCQHSRLAEVWQARQHHVRVHAARQGPEPWDVVETQQQTTAWQQRQQQQLNRQREWRNRQQRGTHLGRPVSPPQRVGPHGRARNARQPGSQPFAACQTYQALYTSAQQLVVAGQQQQLPAAAEGAQTGAPLTDGDAAVPGVAVLQDPPQQQQPGLTAQNCVHLVSQLGVISRNLHGSSSSSPNSSTNQFLEDQALQHTLALVYATIERHLQHQQQHQKNQQPSSSHIPPQQVLRSVSILAGLKYTQPVQLAAWLEAAAAGPALTDPGAFGPGQPAVGPGAAAAGGGAGAGAGAGGSPGGIMSHRQVLMRLRVWELAALVSHLPHAGVRPSNVWLLAFMQVALDKLSSAGLPQLAQLLSGLVKLGVKPTTGWMEAMENRAVQCLLEHAVRQQVDAEQQQQQHEQQQRQVLQQHSAASSQHASATSISSSLRSAGHQQQGRSSPASRQKGPVGCGLHHVALLLTALAEARHSPKPQLAAVLWGATADSLAAAEGPALVEFLTALGELQLLPPHAWLQQYFAASTRETVLQQYKTWQLASSIAALGKLAAASLAAGSRPSQPLKQQYTGDPLGCFVWAAALLGAVQAQLPSFSGRDLAALLSGLAALQLRLEPGLLQQLSTELQGKLPRLNSAGLAAVTEAALAFTQQQQQQGTTAVEQQQLSATFMEALLREVAVKLPVFPAEDLARVLLAVAAAGIQPSQLWVQAAAAQLGSKLTLLEPGTLLAVLKALVGLRAAPDTRWLQQAVTALDGRLLDLTCSQLQELLTLLAALGAKPPTAWLDSADWAIQQQLGQQKQQAAAVVSTLQ